MRFSDELLQGPPEVFARVLALETVYGTVNTYVRGTKKGATLDAVYGQIESARRAGASESEIYDKIRKGIVDPPNASSERVREIKQYLLCQEADS